jgi:signal transduction histidine kinase/HAMP domain-containing protein
MVPTRLSIGNRILAAFLAMSTIVALLGIAGLAVLSAAGSIAVNTYDGPLMAINFARAAQNDFTRARMDALRYVHAAPSERPAIDSDIRTTLSTLFDDLAVAEQRSRAGDERKTIRELRPLIRRWAAMRFRENDAERPALAQRIDDNFDLLIELNTDHSFVDRRHAVANVDRYEYASAGMTVLALFLSFGITLYLSRRIVRPLTAAARVADQIARGELQTPIPRGEGDETGALLHSMTVMQDSIREMMAREIALRRTAESRLVDALDSSNEGVLLVDAEGRILLANRALREFFPAIAADLFDDGRFVEALSLIHAQQIGARPESDNAGGRAEWELADGRWVRVTANPTSEGGKIILLSDFTLVKERENSLHLAIREAQAANAAKTRFVANMSHELRTPLNAIIGFSEVIYGQLFGALGNPRYLEYAGDILRSGRHLLSIINSVLDLAKSDAGKLLLDPQPVDLREVLGDCALMVREQFRSAELSFRCEGLDTPLMVWGDPSKLRQIFLNLLSNAIKFTESGGHVVVTATASGPGITVCVGDDGIGMSEDDIRVALEPFGQVDNRLERRYEGTGLGLPLTQSLVELHGGTLRVESEPGRGTRVSVGLPALKDDALAIAS